METPEAQREAPYTQSGNGNRTLRSKSVNHKDTMYLRHQLSVTALIKIKKTYHLICCVTRSTLSCPDAVTYMRSLLHEHVSVDLRPAPCSKLHGAIMNDCEVML